jgi:hypothetical protein
MIMTEQTTQLQPDIHERYEQWTTIIAHEYVKRGKDKILFDHIKKHLAECMNLKQYQLVATNNIFINKIASLINLVVIYFKKYKFAFKYDIDDYRITSSMLNISFFNIIRYIDERLEYGMEYIYLEAINTAIMKILRDFQLTIPFEKLIERLENYQCKDDVPFNVHEDGEVVECVDVIE